MRWAGPLLTSLRTEYLADPNNGIQIGFPALPEAESPTRFALLRAWLCWCDKSHDCNKHHVESNTELPTRLLYVGDLDDPDYDPDALRLDCARQIDGGK